MYAIHSHIHIIIIIYMYSTCVHLVTVTDDSVTLLSHVPYAMYMYMSSPNTVHVHYWMYLPLSWMKSKLSLTLQHER